MICVFCYHFGTKDVYDYGKLGACGSITISDFQLKIHSQEVSESMVKINFNIISNYNCIFSLMSK